MSACARCALRCGTCCTLRPGDEEFCFPLSHAERKRMKAAGAQARHFVRQDNTQAFVGNIKRLFPDEGAAVEQLFPPASAHDRLATLPDGACALLGPAGCTLPREARPLYCRLFPFWIRAGRERYFELDFCEAQREASGGAGLKKRLGMTSADILQLYHELRTAWGLPERT
ncbi:MAG: hypothetical protein AUJ49_00750 [Desulfovibrionaceae bacterium CG1_02_65_16]|nr:MAG: hypothetical protein AUJ49_00750 [Desulfovibrionaceae bacterium CG1_02_65_16]